jgi:hypothetical protein
MKLIYATGEAEGMSFAVATTPLALPAGAYVYAICDGASVTERVGEDACDEMSAVEYLKFKQMVRDARRSELKRVYGMSTKPGVIDRLRQWFAGADDSNRRIKLRAFGDLIGSH